MKLSAIAFLLAAFAAAPASADAVDHAHDFDFLVGKWHVHHWKLKERLVGSHDWMEFDGTSEMHMALDGHGTFDDNYIGQPNGPYYGAGIRGYDPKTQTWAIWWLDARSPHEIGAPVFGNFKNGVGVFEGNDTEGGRPVITRLTWSKITPTSAHWEQAESTDHGRTWETDWRMDFTRVQ